MQEFRVRDIYMAVNGIATDEDRMCRDSEQVAALDVKGLLYRHTPMEDPGFDVIVRTRRVFS